MSFHAEFTKRTFHFGFDARTSRGQIRDRSCWFLKIKDDQSLCEGIGEIAPLPGLSFETEEDVENELNELVDLINSGFLTGKKINSLGDVHIFFPKQYSSSVRCGIETAFLDLMNGGRKVIFDNSFARRESGLSTNGLIWIGGLDAMLQQVSIKIEQGFRTLKIKIGSLDFEKEIDILQYIRRKYYREKITIRLDANGAFKPKEAFYKLNELARWDVHSIEQPLKAGHVEEMEELCRKTPIPIALDEELVGKDFESCKELIERVKPQFLILKPSLMGGFLSSQKLIELAEEQGIGWWITSALESSIGLNAVAQFTAQYPITIPQGLGTGQIYTDNIDSPLYIEKGELKLDPKLFWEGEKRDGDDDDDMEFLH